MMVRALVDGDRAEWEPLWRGYQEFYHSVIPAEVTELTWRRFHDSGEPMTSTSRVFPFSSNASNPES